MTGSRLLRGAMIRADMLRVLFGTALVLRLLVDIATPLAPGAFRFDPNESVEALRSHAPRLAVAKTVIRLGTSPQPASAPLASSSDAPARVAPNVSAPRVRPLLARQTSDRAAEPSEDH